VNDGPIIELAPALTNVAWSPDLVAQTLEALIVYLAPDGLHHLRPIHAPALHLGLAPRQEPGDVVRDAAERYGLGPRLVHSTSWRHEDDRVVLTYLVVVAVPQPLNENLRDERVSRAELARGEAMAAPSTIGVDQVLEHALQHLSWLVKDDEIVREALPDWLDLLAAYEPEPFRGLGAPA